MPGAVLLLGLVTAQRLCELVWARANTQRLLAAGGREAGAAHYPWLVAFHASWLAGLWIFGHDQPVHTGWLLAYVALQVFRIWILVSLGRRWTTRIVVLPGETLVRRGPYRVLSHPNYVLVAAEIAVLPLSLGLVAYAILASCIHAAVLAIRIDAEDKALTQASRPNPDQHAKA